jgi:Family of unknown function (DUF6088)
MTLETKQSIAASVREHVDTSPAGTFFCRKNFEGSDRAVESELSRLALRGELIRVRHGMYYRGKQTRFGMSCATLLEIATKIAGPGSGPAGVTAAHFLGLTTQVPGTIEVAVPGKIPSALTGARFCVRSFCRRERQLTFVEVAVLELLRDPEAMDVTSSAFRDCCKSLLASEKLRVDVLGEEVAEERHLAARRRWQELQLTS